MAAGLRQNMQAHSKEGLERWVGSEYRSPTAPGYSYLSPLLWKLAGWLNRDCEQSSVWIRAIRCRRPALPGKFCVVPESDHPEADFFLFEWRVRFLDLNGRLLCFG
jgi:hypothetical protein